MLCVLLLYIKLMPGQLYSLQRNEDVPKVMKFEQCLIVALAIANEPSWFSKTAGHASEHEVLKWLALSLFLR